MKTSRLDYYKRFTSEAIQLGYGRFVVDTNHIIDWNPTTKFEWITNYERTKK